MSVMCNWCCSPVLSYKETALRFMSDYFRSQRLKTPVGCWCRTLTEVSISHTAYKTLQVCWRIIFVLSPSARSQEYGPGWRLSCLLYPTSSDQGMFARVKGKFVVLMHLVSLFCHLVPLLSSHFCEFYVFL